MKKFLSVTFVLIMVLSAMPVMAEDFTFDIYDKLYTQSADESVLMEVDADVMAAFEERLIAAWEIFSIDAIDIEDLKITKNNIVSLYSRAFFENPYYFYVKRGFSAKDTDKDGYYDYVISRYNCADEDGIPTEEEIADFKEILLQIDKATEEILLYISPDMTDFEKVMTVHDYMVNNYVYDINDADQTMLIVLDKVGVCAAYAEAFQHMMNVLGIDATLVTSEEMGHMWNMVKIDNRWYHIDVTWDDPVPDQVARVNHKYALLSENAIKELGHTGFEAPYPSRATVYDKAEWRDDEGAIVTVNGVMYRVEGNNLIDENGNVIYENLDGGDGKWSVSKTSYVNDVVWTGLCEINGMLYFNTETGIYSYNPETKVTECVLEEYGIGGLFADKNVIVYNTYDFDTGAFVKMGELKIADVRLGATYYEDGKVVVRLYNDCDAPLWIISRGNGYMVQKVDSKSIGTARFDNGDEQTIYIWKNSLEPVFEPFAVSE